jgi:ferredoxin
MRTLLYLADVVTLRLAAAACTGCGMCQVVCPHAVFAVAGGRARIVARDACMECGACARNCPAAAISVQSGVGCAQAVRNAALGRSAACGSPARSGQESTSRRAGGAGSSCRCGEARAAREKGVPPFLALLRFQ